MTDALNVYNMQELINKKEEKYSRNEKINSIVEVVKIKTSEQVDEIIKNNINFDKKVRSGKATIKGTRITPKELILATSEMASDNFTFNDLKKYLYEQYPSITQEIQIEAAVYYCLKYDISLFKYIVAVIMLK